MEMTPTNSLNSETASVQGGRSALVLIFIIVFIDLLGFAIVLPLLPRYAERFHASDATIGMLFACFSAMQFIFAPLWGRLSDRIGRRPVLIAGLLGSVVFYALFGVATIVESLALMFAARIGAGIAGATISTAQAYIADSTGVQSRAKGMAMIGAAFGIGFTVGPILGSIALSHHPPVAPGEPLPLNPWPGFMASILSFCALLVCFFKLPESLRQRNGNAPKRTWLNIGALKEAIKVPSVGALLLLFFVVTFAFTQFEATLSRLTEAAFGMNEKDNFYLFTYMGVMLSLIQGVLYRKLAPKLGEAKLIIAGTILMGSGFWLMSIAADSGSAKMLYWVMPILICGFSFLTPSTQSLISRRSDPSRQGEIMGVNQSASAMARILGPMFGNILFGFGIRTGYGPKLPYQAAALLLVPGLILAIREVRLGQDWTTGA